MTAAAALLAVLLFSAVASAATYNVNNSDDTSDAAAQTACTDGTAGCTLRASLDLANSSAEADTINLQDDTYRIEGQGDNDNGEGDLDTACDAGDLTINGVDSRRTVLDGGGNDRVLDIGSYCPIEVDETSAPGGVVTPPKVTINKLTIRNGVTGPEYSYDDIPSYLNTSTAATTLLQQGFDYCASDYSGGGIRAGYGTDVTINDSSVSYNRAGSLHPFSSYGFSSLDGLLGVLNNFGVGGGIASNGNLTLNRTLVRRNVSGLLGGGIATGANALLVYGPYLSIGGGNSALEVNDSTIDDNVATIAAGGIYNSSKMDVARTTISGNGAIVAAGGVANVTPYPLQALGSQPGGEEQPPEEQPNTIVNSTLNDNLTRLLVGGAIVNLTGGLDLTNDTIANDQTASTILGRLFGYESDLNFLEGRGAGIFALGGPVRVKNSIVAANTDDGYSSNCWDEGEGSVESLGHNLVDSDPDRYPDDNCSWSDGSGDVPADIIGANPRLDDPHENGGPTLTMALLPDSPALDAAADCPATDQRGGHRPPAPGSAGSACDIGAFESYSLGDLSVAANVAGGDPSTVGDKLTYTLVTTNDGPDKINVVSLTDTLPAGVTFLSASPGCTLAAGTVSCDLGSMERNQVKTVKIDVRPNAPGTLSDTATIGAPGMTDTNGANDSASVTSGVVARASAPSAPGDQDVLGFRSLKLLFSAPSSVTVDQFLAGIVVNSHCAGDKCDRFFREHAKIKTGAARIAAYNLTLARVHVKAGKKGRVRLRPCVTGTTVKAARHPKKSCMRQLSEQARKFAPFKVKLVVAAKTKDGRHAYKKRYVRVTK